MTRNVLEAYEGKLLSNSLIYEFEHYDKERWNVCDEGFFFPARLVSWIKGGVKHHRS